MNTEKSKFWQQGDVIVFDGKSVEGFSGIPADAKKLENRNWLALGEHTGHAHRVTQGEFELFEDSKGTLYMRAKTDCVLTHEEHNAHVIPAGDHVIGLVQEFDPFAKAIRNVRD